MKTLFIYNSGVVVTVTVTVVNKILNRAFLHK